MRRTVLSTFFFVAILGLCCMGVAVPAKADELKHPIDLKPKCKTHFEKFLDWDRYYKTFAYVSGNLGHACVYREGTEEALEACNSYNRGECKVYAKSPVNGKVAIVWEEGETGQRSKTSSQNNRYTSSQDKKHIRQLCKRYGRNHIWGGPRYGNIDCRRTVPTVTAEKFTKQRTNLETVYGVSVPLKSAPSEYASKIANIGGSVIVLGYTDNGDWARVKAMGYTGFVRSSYLKGRLKKPSPTDTAAKTATPSYSALARCSGSPSSKIYVERGWTHCYGKFNWGNGNEYDGEWKDGRPHGRGTHVYASGTIEKGVWANGEFLYTSPTVTAEKSPTPPADMSALKTSELNISFQTKKQGRIVKRKVPRKRAKAWFVGPDGKESAKTLTWDRKKKRYTTSIKHQDRKEVRVKVKAFGKYAAVSVLAQLDGGVQSIEMNLEKPILFIAWDPNLGLIKQKLRKKGVLRHTTALTNFIAAINTSSNRHHWSHLHVVDVNKDGAFREILSDLHGRAIQWNAKTNEDLKTRLRERVLSGAPVSPNKIIEPVGKFVSGFSYGPKATRAHLIYVLEKPTTGISNDDLKQMEDLLKQQRMSATILQFGHTDGEELKILTGGKKQFQRLQFVQADITKSFHNDYFFSAFDRAAQLVAAQTKRRLKQEKILLTAQLAEAKSVKARIPRPKLKPKAAKRLKAKPATEKRSTTSSGDFRKGMDAYERGDFTTALRKWKPLAEEGNARAQFWLGWMYENGKGTPENYRTALKWYRLAADQGHIFAKSSIRAHQEKVAKQKPTPKVAPRLHRTDAYVDVLATPSRSGRFLAELEKGKIVEVISETKDGRWLKIKWKGTVAYVKNRNLSAVQMPKVKR